MDADIRALFSGQAPQYKYITSLPTKVRVFRHVKCLKNAEGILQLYQYFIESLLRKIYKEFNLFYRKILNLVQLHFVATQYHSIQFFDFGEAQPVKVAKNTDFCQ